MRNLVSAGLLMMAMTSHAQKLSPSRDLDHPFLTISKDNTVVDFKGRVFQGTPQTTEPDQRVGLGILVTGKNVTLKNLTVRGYKVGLMARGANGLKLIHVDASYNWKQHLLSDIEQEDESDWMSYHHNENHEWFRYGAGIYLDEVNKFDVHGCLITGGQCGLMLNRSNQGQVWGNKFTFLSGLGIGMYRSSNNRVMQNQLDFCVRGYSHGVYNRGQDSAGILIFEQCMKNLFAYNSVTHGGDGFFLWAGQNTMDTGQGGCNDNLVYGNDFSDAPTNGIEATFSRNKFINNRVDRCWHGVWGGFSYDSLIECNFFADNDEGVSIEHGQSIAIRGNQMVRNKIDVNVWANPISDQSWGYPKHRDTASRDFMITGNTFGAKVQLKDTTGGALKDNTILGASAIRGTLPDWSPQTTLASMPKPLNPHVFLPRSSAPMQGRQYILVDEWGPNDYRFPRVWPKPVFFKPDKMAGQQMEVVGPKGRWHVVSHNPQIKVFPDSGTVPGKLHVLPLERFNGNTTIELEFVGNAATDYRGIKYPAGKPIRFKFERSKLGIQWNLKWYAWDKDTQDPRTQPKAFDKLIAGAPLADEKMMEVNFNWPGIPHKGVPHEHFATIGEGDFEVSNGDYDIEITSDDGCRLSLDGRLLVDEWHYQGPTTFTKRVHLSGHHHLSVRHFQIDGYACLHVKVKPVKK